jgi:hypothetical protein
MLLRLRSLKRRRTTPPHGGTSIKPVTRSGDLRKNVSRIERTDRNRAPNRQCCNLLAYPNGSRLTPLLGTYDSLCTIDLNCSAELSTMLLRFCSLKGRCAASWITSGTVSEEDRHLRSSALRL